MGTHPRAAGAGRQKLELADIVRLHASAYRAAHRLAPVQVRALRAIEACRTEALGGHVAQCDACGGAILPLPLLPQPPLSKVNGYPFSSTRSTMTEWTTSSRLRAGTTRQRGASSRTGLPAMKRAQRIWSN